VRIANANPDTIRPGWLVHGLPSQIERSAGLSGVFFCKATYRMHHEGMCEPWPEPEQPTGDVPMDNNPELGLGYASDFVPFKPHGEYAITGNAYPPKETFTMFPIGARIGDTIKRFVGFGKREWSGTMVFPRPGEAGVAAKIPLNYTKAWGGLNYGLNPIGMGREGAAMPLLELHEKKVVSRRDQLMPAGFAPIPREWTVRSEKLGSYGGDWLKTRWPWFPDDFDWTYFNASPPNQWIKEYFRGDEKLDFINLHPSIPHFHTRLPGVVARCFVTRVVEGRESMVPVELHLDTIWARPEEEKLILVWRGRTPVSSLKLTDVSKLLFLLEPLGQAERPLEEYAALQEELLAPPVPPPETGPLPDTAKIQAELDAAVAEWKQWEADFRREVDDAEKAARDHISKTTGIQQAGWGDQVTIPNPLEPPASASWPDDIAAQVSALTDDASMREVAGTVRPEMEKAIGEAHEFDKKLAEREAEALSKFPDWMKREPPPKDEPVDPAGVGEEGFGNLTLDGYDFSGLDLTGSKFAGATLLNCNFTGATLTRACFEGAQLTRVDLTDAKLIDADLRRAVLEECQVEGTCWTGTDFTNARLNGLSAPAGDFSRAHGTNAHFADANLSGACFMDARLPFAIFSGANLEKADFSCANLTDADVAGARARGLILAGCDLTRFRAGFGADLSGADIRRARGERSIWKGSRFEEACFGQSVLNGAQFSEACLRRAELDRCHLVGATFEDADLEEAVLTNANLFEVLFDRANLTRCNLDGSNLYESSFWEAELLSASWRRANVKKTVLEGR